ncbi:MAG: arylesterase, partial [Verrucomicrobiota bacterium]
MLHRLIKIGFTLIAIYVSQSATIADETDSRSILFLGDSLTAGLGIAPDQAFPALVAQKIIEQELPFKVIPSGVSGETSAGGLRRIDWMLRKPVSILVLALGANDGLRGIDLSDTEQNLQKIIEKTKAKNPEVKVLLAGMLMPPNLGPEYTTQFKEMYPKIANNNGATLIPFLLEDVAGEKRLNLPDGIHPNPA